MDSDRCIVTPDLIPRKYLEGVIHIQNFIDGTKIGFSLQVYTFFQADLKNRIKKYPTILLQQWHLRIC